MHEEIKNAVDEFYKNGCKNRVTTARKYGVSMDDFYCEVDRREYEMAMAESANIRQ